LLLNYRYITLFSNFNTDANRCTSSLMGLKLAITR
jgi:hypothetical protein